MRFNYPIGTVQVLKTNYVVCAGHVFMLCSTLLSSPPGSLVMLAALQGKLSSSCRTDCPCIATLCVRYLPFVWHALDRLAGSCFLLVILGVIFCL